MERARSREERTKLFASSSSSPARVEEERKRCSRGQAGAAAFAKLPFRTFVALRGVLSALQGSLVLVEGETGVCGARLEKTLLLLISCLGIMRQPPRVVDVGVRIGLGRGDGLVDATQTT